MDEQITREREALEAMIWEITAWRGARDAVNKLLCAVDAFATMKAEWLSATRVGTGGRGLFAGPSPADDRALNSAPVKTEMPAEPAPVTDVDEKICKSCGIAKEYKLFTRDKTRSDGYLSRCKACVKEGRKIPKAAA